MYWFRFEMWKIHIYFHFVNIKIFSRKKNWKIKKNKNEINRIDQMHLRKSLQSVDWFATISMQKLTKSFRKSLVVSPQWAEINFDNEFKSNFCQFSRFSHKNRANRLSLSCRHNCSVTFRTKRKLIVFTRYSGRAIG